MIEKLKVLTYITHQGRLLVFRQPDHPEVGIQVPGGSVEPNEDLDAAALREAWEETGLHGLVIEAYLGVVVHDLRAKGRDEIYHRHIYHLLCTETPPERWQHHEMFPSDGSPAPVLFDLYWVALDDVPPLLAEQDVLLDVLKGRLT
ncbi:MAG: NUDIX domain-containing protein [Anaerolineae bacterium]